MARLYFRGKRWMELHRELKLKPWEWNPLDVSDGEQPYPGYGWMEAQKLSKELTSGN